MPAHIAVFDLGKGQLDVIDTIGRDADAAVGDLNFQTAEVVAPSGDGDIAMIRRKFQNIGQNIQQSLLQQPAVANQARQPDGNMVQNIGPPAIGPPLGDTAAVSDQGGNVHLVLHQGRYPGLNAGKIQNVIDNGQQVFNTIVDIADVTLVLLLDEGAEHLVLDDLGKSDNGIQRRAQLVAHIGQEFGFGAISDL